MHRALSLVPSTSLAITWETEARESRTQVHPQLYREFKDSLTRRDLSQKGKETKENKPPKKFPTKHLLQNEAAIEQWDTSHILKSM